MCRQWGCVKLFKPLASPSCNGVITWTEVGHLLQMYWCSVVLYFYIIQFLLQYSIWFDLIFPFSVQKWKAVRKYITAFTTAIYINLLYYHSKVRMSITFQSWNIGLSAELSIENKCHRSSFSVVMSTICMHALHNQHWMGWPGVVAESVEHWFRVLEIVGSNPGRVKPMTYKTDTCRFLAKCSPLLG